jgi:hypothetical protein
MEYGIAGLLMCSHPEQALRFAERFFVLISNTPVLHASNNPFSRYAY